jgi:hypothetical protein
VESIQVSFHQSTYPYILYNSVCVSVVFISSLSKGGYQPTAQPPRCGSQEFLLRAPQTVGLSVRFACAGLRRQVESDTQTYSLPGKKDLSVETLPSASSFMLLLLSTPPSPLQSGNVVEGRSNRYTRIRKIRSELYFMEFISNAVLSSFTD